MELIKKIETIVKEKLSVAKGSHDWEHTQRVYELAVHIAEKEDADMEIVKLAAMLHDIARPEQDMQKGKICHAKKGAEIAAEILVEYGVDPEKIEKIVHCIKCHRFRKGNVPESKEAKVLFDADKLDSVGAVGIGRAFLFAGENHAKLHNKDIVVEETEEYSEEDTAYREFLVKLSKIKDKMMTGEGKRIAEGRHKYMVGFFDRLNKEVDGEL